MDSSEYALGLKLKSKFEAAGNKYRIEPSLLAAIASRESNTGTNLDNIYAYGMMQINIDAHTVDDSKGPKSLAHIMQAADILRYMIDTITDKFPNWSRSNQLRGGIAAYNCGPEKVRNKRIDEGTHGGNYSEDVLDRQAEIQNVWNKRY